MNKQSILLLIVGLVAIVSLIVIAMQANTVGQAYDVGSLDMSPVSQQAIAHIERQQTQEISGPVIHAACTLFCSNLCTDYCQGYWNVNIPFKGNPRLLCYDECGNQCMEQCTETLEPYFDRS